jgi:hypothetical protein
MYQVTFKVRTVMQIELYIFIQFFPRTKIFPLKHRSKQMYTNALV